MSQIRKNFRRFISVVLVASLSLSTPVSTLAQTAGDPFAEVLSENTAVIELSAGTGGNEAAAEQAGAADAESPDVSDIGDEAELSAEIAPEAEASEEIIADAAEEIVAEEVVAAEAEEAGEPAQNLPEDRDAEAEYSSASLISEGVSIVTPEDLSDFFTKNVTSEGVYYLLKKDLTLPENTFLRTIQKKKPVTFNLDGHTITGSCEGPLLDFGLSYPDYSTDNVTIDGFNIMDKYASYGAVRNENSSGSAIRAGEKLTLKNMTVMSAGNAAVYAGSVSRDQGSTLPDSELILENASIRSEGDGIHFAGNQTYSVEAVSVPELPVIITAGEGKNAIFLDGQKSALSINGGFYYGTIALNGERTTAVTGGFYEDASIKEYLHVVENRNYILDPRDPAVEGCGYEVVPGCKVDFYTSKAAAEDGAESGKIADPQDVPEYGLVQKPQIASGDQGRLPASFRALGESADWRFNIDTVEERDTLSLYVTDWTAPEVEITHIDGSKETFAKLTDALSSSRGSSTQDYHMDRLLSDDTIKLLTDVELETDRVLHFFWRDRDLKMVDGYTLDLNGHTLTGHASRDGVIYVDRTHFTIMDSSTGKKGSVINKGVSAVLYAYLYSFIGSYHKNVITLKDGVDLVTSGSDVVTIYDYENNSGNGFTVEDAVLRHDPENHGGNYLRFMRTGTNFTIDIQKGFFDGKLKVDAGAGGIPVKKYTGGYYTDKPLDSYPADNSYGVFENPKDIPEGHENYIYAVGKKVLVTFKMNGAPGADPEQKSFYQKKGTQLPAFPELSDNDDYLPKGWYTKDGISGDWGKEWKLSDPVNDNTILYLKWTAPEAKIVRGDNTIYFESLTDATSFMTSTDPVRMRYVKSGDFLYLLKDVELKNAPLHFYWTDASGANIDSVFLNLNGHTITGNTAGMLLYVDRINFFVDGPGTITNQSSSGSAIYAYLDTYSPSKSKETLGIRNGAVLESGGKVLSLYGAERGSNIELNITGNDTALRHTAGHSGDFLYVRYFKSLKVNIDSGYYDGTITGCHYADMNITGGHFTERIPENLLAEGYRMVEDTTGLPKEFAAYKYTPTNAEVCAVSFNMNGSTRPAPGSIAVKKDAKISELPVLADGDDLIYRAWYKDPECTRVWNLAEDKVNSDITLYLGWAAPEAKILRGTKTIYVEKLNEVSAAYTQSAAKHAVHGDTVVLLKNVSLNSGVDHQLTFHTPAADTGMSAYTLDLNKKILSGDVGYIVDLRDAKLTVTGGGIIENKGTDSGAAIGVSSGECLEKFENEAEIFVDDAVLTAHNAIFIDVPLFKASVTINGGSFAGKGTGSAIKLVNGTLNLSVTGGKFGSLIDKDEGTITGNLITGGLFAGEQKEHLATDYVCVQESGDANYPWIVKKADNVALNVTTGVYYTSLQSAVSDVENDGAVYTIRLLKNTKEHVSFGTGTRIILDLNGCTVTAENSRIFDVYAESLTIRDSSAAGTGKLTGGNAAAGNNGGAVYVHSGVFTLESGTIADSRAGQNIYDRGGAVYINGGTFYMKGGKITGCSASQGQAVSVSNGKFLMSGGSISGGTGGEASVYSYLSDVHISGNARITDNGGSFGGLYLNQSFFTMTGGEISGNADHARDGSGLYFDGGSEKRLQMTGGLLKTKTPGRPLLVDSGSAPDAGFGIESCSFDYKGKAVENPEWMHLVNYGYSGIPNTDFTKWTVVHGLKITYLDQGGSAFSGRHEGSQPNWHQYGTETILKKAYKENFSFGGWYLDSGCTGAPVTALGARDYVADITLYAKWAGADPVAQIGDKTFVTLQEAFDAVKSGETIVLLSDIVLTESAMLRNDDYSRNISVTLDLDGHTITGSLTDDQVIGAENLDLTLKNGTIENTGASSSYTRAVYLWNGHNPKIKTLMLNDMVIKAPDRAVETYGYSPGTVSLLVGNSTIISPEYAIFPQNGFSRVLLKDGDFVQGKILYDGHGAISPEIDGGYYSVPPNISYISSFNYSVFDTDEKDVSVDRSIYRYAVDKADRVEFKVDGRWYGSTQMVRDGRLAKRPADPTVTEHQTFAGWYTKDGSTTDPQTGEPDWGKKWNFEEDAVTGYTVLYAKIDTHAFTVSFDLNGHGAEKPADQVVAYGKFVEKPAVDPEDPGHAYVFDGWYRTAQAASDEKWNFDADPVTEDITLYAGWKEAVVKRCDNTGVLKAIYADENGSALAKALHDAASGDKVLILDDLSNVLSAGLTGVDITLDLNGHDIAASDDTTYVFYVNNALLTVVNSGDTLSAVTGGSFVFWLDVSAQLAVDSPLVSVFGKKEYAAALKGSGAGVQIGNGRFRGGKDAIYIQASEVSGSVTGGLYSHEVPAELLEEGCFCMPNTDADTKADYPYTVRGDVAAVHFDTAGHGEAPEDQFVVIGERLANPGITEAEGGYLLTGWYVDPSCEGEPWNFAEDTVTASMTLTAKWEFAEVYYAAYDSEEKYQLHPVSTFNEAVEKIRVSEKAKHVILLNQDISYASPSVFTKKTELDLNGKVFTGDSVSYGKEYLIKAENCDLTIKDSSAGALGLIYNSSEDASSTAVLLEEQEGINGSHTFAIEGGTIFGIHAVTAEENYARIEANSGSAYLMGVSLSKETDEESVVTNEAVAGAAFTFKNPSMQLSVTDGYFAGAFQYAGSEALSLNVKLTGGHFTERPDQALIAVGYGAVLNDASWYAYDVKKAVTVHFEDALHPEEIPDQTVALGAKVTDPGEPAGDGWTFEGWWTKKAEEESEEPVWDKQWNFEEDVITDKLHKLREITLHAKWTKCEAMIERTESEEKKSYRFETLKDAVAASDLDKYPDETVILETDVSLNETLVINKNLKLDLNGKTLKADAEMAENVPLLTVAPPAADSAAAAPEFCIIADSASYIKNPGKTAISVTGADGQLTIARDAKVSISGAVTYTKPEGGIHTTPAEGHGIMGGFYTVAPAKELIASGYTSFTNEESAEYIYLVDKAWIVTFLKGERTETSVVRDNTPAAKPQDPEKEGFLFDGWWTKKEDGSWDQKWDFTTSVTADLTLTAKFDVIVAELQYYTHPEAAPGEEQEPVPVSVKESFRTLTEAVNKANSLNDSDAVLTLCADVTLPAGESVELNIGQPWRLTFDLNGHTLNGSVDTSNDGISAASGKKALVEVRNAVTMKDSSNTQTAAGTGAIVNTAGNAVFYTVPVAGGVPDLMIESGSFTAGTITGDTFTKAGNAVEISDGDAKLMISGGKFAGSVLYTGDTMEKTETRAEISGGLYTTAPFKKYLVKGYAIKDLGKETYRYQVEQESYTAHFETNGGKTESGGVPEDQTGLHYGDKVTMPAPITKKDAEHPEKVYIFDGWYTENQPASGTQPETGTRMWNFDNDTVEGSMTLYAWWSEAVASVTYTPAGEGQKTKNFVNLTDAVNVATANSGAVLKLLASVAGPLAIAEPTGKTLTLDLNGRNITAAGSPVGALDLTGAGSVTITDTAAAKGSVTNPDDAAITICAGALRIENGNIGAAVSTGKSPYAVKYTGSETAETTTTVTIADGRFRGAFSNDTKCPIRLEGGHFDSIKEGAAIEVTKTWVYDAADRECPYTVAEAAASYDAGGNLLNFASLDGALAYAKTSAGGTLTMLTDVTEHKGTDGKNTPIVIPAAMTFDLNGHDIIFAVSGEGETYESSSYPVLYAEGGDLLIRNGSALKTGTVKNTAAPQKQGTTELEETIPPAVIKADHKLSIEAGNFGGKIFCVTGDITGGNFSHDPTGNLRTGYEAKTGGPEGFPYQVSIMSFTLIFDANGGKFVNGGISPKSISKDYGELITGEQVQVNRSGYRFDGWQYEVTVTEKTGEGTEEKTTTRTETRTWNYEPVTRNIPGAVEGDVSYTGNITAKWTKYVAIIEKTGAYYTSLQDAVNAAASNDTIKLLTGISESVTVSGKTLAIDLNGQTITGDSGSGTLNVKKSAVTIKGEGTVTNTGSGSGIYMSGSDVTIDGAGKGTTKVTSSKGNGITADQKTDNTLYVKKSTVKGKTNGISGDKAKSSGSGKFKQEYDYCSIEGEDGSALDETMWSDNASVTSESSDFVGKECGIKAENIEFHVNGGSIKGGTNALQILGVAVGTIGGAALIGAIVYAKYKEYKLILYGCAIVVGVTIAVELLKWLLGSDGGKNHDNDVKVPVEFYSKNERQASYSMKVGTYVGGDKARAGNLTEDEILVGWKESVPYVVDPVSFPVRVDNYTRFDAKIEGKKTVKFNTVVDDKPTVRDAAKPAEQKVKHGEKATEPPEADRLPLDSNYKFKQWNDGGSKYDFNQPVREDKTLQIVWEKVASVTIKTTGGITLYSREFATLYEALLVANNVSSVISEADLSRVGSVTVKLLKDISDTLCQPRYVQGAAEPLPGYAFYEIRSDMTLDLNGKKHTENWHVGSESTEIYRVVGAEGKTPKFTVTDSSSAANGRIVTNIPESSAIRVMKNDAQIIVKKGTVEAASSAKNAILLSVPAKVLVEGGTVTSQFIAVNAADGSSVEVKGGTVSAKRDAIYSAYEGDEGRGISFAMSDGYVKGTGTASDEGYAVYVVHRSGQGTTAEGPVRGEITGGNMYGKAYLDNLSMGIIPAFTLKGGYYSEDSHGDLSGKLLILAFGYSWADSSDEKTAEGYPWTVEKDATVKFNENGGRPHPANQIVKIGDKVQEPYVYQADKELDGWYTKDGSTTDPQTRQPDWGRKWDFSAAVQKDDLDKNSVLTLTAKWKDTDSFVAKVTYASGAAEKKFTELGPAFNEVLADGDKVTMLSDYQIPDTEGLKDEHQYMVISKNITFDLAGFQVSGNTLSRYTGLLRIGRGTSAVVEDTSITKTGSLENTGTLPTLYTEGALEIKNAEILHELREGSGDVISGTKNGSVTVKEKNTRIKGHLADSTCTFVLTAGRYEEKPLAKHLADKYISVKNDDAKTLSEGYNYTVIRGDGTASLMVAGYDFFVNGMQQKSYYIEEFPVGTEITLDYKGDVKDFSCWADDFYRTLSTESSYTFALTKDIVIACVSAQMIKKGESVIVYKSDEDILSTGFYHVSDDGEIVDTAGKALEVPADPQSSDGRTFKQWSLQKSEILQKMQDGVPIITVEAVFEGSEEEFTVRVTSGTLIDGGATVTPVSGGGKFKAGEVTTVTAVDPDPEKTGKYQFLGWFVKKDGEDSFVPLGGAEAWKLSFTYTVTEKVTLKAVFRPLATFNLAVKAEDFSVSVNGGAFADYHTEYKAALPAGTVTLRFNEKPGKKFKYWVNDSQKVCSRTPEFTFTMVADADIYAVYYDEQSESSSYVIYESAYGMVISSRLYTTGSEIVPPRVPQVTGKTAVGWDKTVDEIKALIGTESCIVVKPVYENKEGTYSLTVKYTYTDESGTINLRPQEIYTLSIATSKELRAEPQIIVEDIKDGKATYHFHSWKLNGVIVSTSPRYFAYGMTDGEEIAVTACYSKAEQKPEPLVKITKSSTGRDEQQGKYVYSFTQYYDVPDGYEILEIGSLRTEESAYATEKYMVTNSDYSLIKKYLFSTGHKYGDCTLDLYSAYERYYYYRAFITVKNNDTGLVETHYSQIAEEGIRNNETKE